MAQIGWMGLALYTFFGFHQLGGPEIQMLDKKNNLGNEVEVSVGGVKLSIPKKYLDCGFPLFSFYATGIFYYIAFQKNRSPSKTRKDLLNFNDKKLPVELMRDKGRVEMGTFRSYIATFFPKLDPYSFNIRTVKGGNTGMVGDQQIVNFSEKFMIDWPKERLSRETKFLCCIGNSHYALPLFLNVVVWVLYLYTVFFVEV